MIETGTKGPREQAKRDQKGGTEGMRDRGANGPRDRGNKEASNAAVSARRTGSQEPKAAFSLFVLSFLYSLLTDSARQARGQKPGARSFFSVPCSLFPWSLPGPPATGLRRWGGLFPAFPPPPCLSTPPPPPGLSVAGFSALCSLVPLVPCSLFFTHPPYIPDPTPHAVL